MRRFHNAVKSDLLSLAVKGKSDVHLLDFGCGFGGDIAKWKANGIKNVVGVDPSEPAVTEARTRFWRFSKGELNYHFLHEPHPLAFVESLPDGCVDVVTFHFALHYYPRHEQVQAIKALRRVLARDGVLVVTCMDGRRVMQYQSNDFMNIKMINASEIEVRLQDSVYFDSIGVSREYLCFPTFLTRECAGDFKKIDVVDFSQFDHKDLDQVSRAASFLHVALVFHV